LTSGAFVDMWRHRVNQFAGGKRDDGPIRVAHAARHRLRYAHRHHSRLASS
jgi:hypothetical protein